MKSSSILGCLFAITLCTSLCIAETYTTTKTYYQPVKTVTTTVYDATTNPMYSVNRNDKIQAVQGQLSAPKTVTTTVVTEPSKVTKTVVEETKTVKEKAEAKTEEAVIDTQKDVQSALSYYENLRTCTMGSMNSSKLSLRTYGNNNGLCNFDMAKENPKTGRMVTVCTFNAPMEATKKYAENMIKYEKGLIGLEKLSTAEFTALTSSLSTFTQQYCK